MQFIDLKTQYQRIKPEVAKRMERVLEHGQFIMGPEVAELEGCLTDYIGSRHCITVSNGTEALLIALMALDIKAGDEVITSPFSFIASVEMLLLLGIKPVYVDIDPRTYNINAALIEQAITPKTKAILPINLYGQCADYATIQAVAKKHKLYIIEDAAQSFGAIYQGRKSCTLGDISYTSFFPAKPLGGYGEGGACFTDDDELALRMQQIRNHGQDRRYHHVRLGVNGRLDTLKAAILLAKLDIFQEELEERQRIAAKYDELLKDYVETPFIHSDNMSAYAQYTIRLEGRDKLAEALAKQQIPTAVHYPVAIHQQPVVKKLQPWISTLVESEYAAQHVLSLPFSPYLTEIDQCTIVNAIVEATMKGNSQIAYGTNL